MSKKDKYKKYKKEDVSKKDKYEKYKKEDIFTSLMRSINSDSVGFCPRERITLW